MIKQSRVQFGKGGKKYSKDAHFYNSLFVAPLKLIVIELLEEV